MAEISGERLKERLSMTRDQAYFITTRYGGVPRNRSVQEGLIDIFYNRKLHGRPINECDDDQVFQVARRLYLQACGIVDTQIRPIAEVVKRTVASLETALPGEREAILERAVIQAVDLPDEHTLNGKINDALRKYIFEGIF